MPEAEVIQNRPFISVGRYGLARRTSYIHTANLLDVLYFAKNHGKKAAFLNENAQYWFDIDLARVSIGKGYASLTD